MEADGTDDVDSFCKLCETCLPIKPSAISLMLYSSLKQNYLSCIVTVHS